MTITKRPHKHTERLFDLGYRLAPRKNGKLWQKIVDVYVYMYHIYIVCIIIIYIYIYIAICVCVCVCHTLFQRASFSYSFHFIFSFQILDSLHFVALSRGQEHRD